MAWNIRASDVAEGLPTPLTARRPLKEESGRGVWWWRTASSSCGHDLWGNQIRSEPAARRSSAPSGWRRSGSGLFTDTATGSRPRIAGG